MQSALQIRTFVMDDFSKDRIFIRPMLVATDESLSVLTDHDHGKSRQNGIALLESGRESVSDTWPNMSVTCCLGQWFTPCKKVVHASQNICRAGST